MEDDIRRGRPRDGDEKCGSGQFEWYMSIFSLHITACMFILTTPIQHAVITNYNSRDCSDDLSTSHHIYLSFHGISQRYIPAKKKYIVPITSRCEVVIPCILCYPLSYYQRNQNSLDEGNRCLTSWQDMAGSTWRVERPGARRLTGRRGATRCGWAPRGLRVGGASIIGSSTRAPAEPHVVLLRHRLWSHP